MNKLALQSFAGLAFLLGFLALLLFLPAWTLDYWQAWVFLAVFGISVSLISLDVLRNDPKLMESRIQARATAEQQTTQKVIQAAATFFFMLPFIVAGLDHRFGWSNIPLALVILGDALVVLGLFIVFRVFRENSFTSATIEVQQEQKVISTGPYAWVRHPMYAGAFVMLLGVPLALGSWWGLPLVFLLMLVIIIRSLDEEKFLAKNLPGYTDYSQKVRYRLIPWIW